MLGRLEGKVILVAGAGGIGGGLARRYASEGASVLLGDIDLAAAQVVAEEIGNDGGTAIGIELDGADDEGVKSAVELAMKRFGGLDGLHVNFASFADGESGEDVVDLSLEVYDKVMHVNARGFVVCTRHAVPAMLARGGGSIVYTSSGAAHKGEPLRVAYAMSKSAVHALMRHVANRYGPEGIRANVIAPGVIDHPRFAEVMPDQIVEQFRQDCPLKLLGTPDDIAAMGALLLSDDGRYVTGQVISVDGGMTMRP